MLSSNVVQNCNIIDNNFSEILQGLLYKVVLEYSLILNTKCIENKKISSFLIAYKKCKYPQTIYDFFYPCHLKCNELAIICFSISFSDILYNT